jgi:CheY-like chemotaxis protein
MNSSAAESQPRIVVLEDNAADVYLLQKALQRAQVTAAVEYLPDGEAAIHYFLQQGPYRATPRPDMLILDLHLPKYSGFEVLQCLQEHDMLQQVTVIIFSTSDDPHDRRAAEALHVDQYVVKSANLATFMQMGQYIKEALATRQAGKRTEAQRTSASLCRG